MKGKWNDSLLFSMGDVIENQKVLAGIFGAMLSREPNATKVGG